MIKLKILTHWNACFCDFKQNKINYFSISECSMRWWNQLNGEKSLSRNAYSYYKFKAKET